MTVKQEKGLDCSTCVAYRCRKINSEYPRMRTKHKFSAKQLAKMECKGYMKARPWKVPLLMHLATKSSKVQAMNDLLSAFHFQLREKEKYPYFHLNIKKARR